MQSVALGTARMDSYVPTTVFAFPIHTFGHAVQGSVNFPNFLLVSLAEPACQPSDAILLGGLFKFAFLLLANSTQLRLNSCASSFIIRLFIARPYFLISLLTGISSLDIVLEVASYDCKQIVASFRSIIAMTCNSYAAMVHAIRELHKTCRYD